MIAPRLGPIVLQLENCVLKGIHASIMTYSLEHGRGDGSAAPRAPPSGESETGANPSAVSLFQARAGKFRDVRGAACWPRNSREARAELTFGMIFRSGRNPESRVAHSEK